MHGQTSVTVRHETSGGVEDGNLHKTGGLTSRSTQNVTNVPAEYIYLFVAHWCPHCQAEVPRIVGWMQSGQIPTGLLWRTVSTAVTPSRGNYPPSAWFTRVRWDQPVMVDSTTGDAATAFGLQSFPYLIFVDAHGVVKQRATGELTIDQLKAAIASITG